MTGIGTGDSLAAGSEGQSTMELPRTINLQLVIAVAAAMLTAGGSVFGFLKTVDGIEARAQLNTRELERITKHNDLQDGEITELRVENARITGRLDERERAPAH